MRGLFKVLNGNERNLSAAESQAIVKFKIPLPEDQKELEANQNELDQNLSYAEKLLAMKRVVQSLYELQFNTTLFYQEIITLV